MVVFTTLNTDSALRVVDKAKAANSGISRRLTCCLIDYYRIFVDYSEIAINLLKSSMAQVLCY